MNKKQQPGGCLGLFAILAVIGLLIMAWEGITGNDESEEPATENIAAEFDDLDNDYSYDDYEYDDVDIDDFEPATKPKKNTQKSTPKPPSIEKQVRQAIHQSRLAMERTRYATSSEWATHSRST